MSNYEGFVEEIEEYVKRADTFIIPKEGKALNAFQHDCCEAFFGDIHVDNGKHLSSKGSPLLQSQIDLAKYSDEVCRHFQQYCR